MHRSTFIIGILAVFVFSCLRHVQSREFQTQMDFIHEVQRRDANPQDNMIMTVNTTGRLAALRTQMTSRGLAAYIVPSKSAHEGGDISKRAYISGFTGSAGKAVVTLNKAALWTDSRYYIQAGKQLDNNWILMKESSKRTSKAHQWLSKVLSKGDQVGVDPYLLSMSTFKEYKEDLSRIGLQLVAVTPNLVDQIWKDKPAKPNGTLITLALKYTGKSWQDKVSAVRETMRPAGATAMVIPQLDEIAWLLNMRDNSYPPRPVFVSYVIITADQIMLFIDSNKITSAVRSHLSIDDCSSMCVRLKAYDQLTDEVANITAINSSKIWISPESNQGLFMSINASKALLKESPIRLMKSIKNRVEIGGMKKANLKDAVAICEFFHWLEKQVVELRADVTELDASAKLEEFKSRQEDYMGRSFTTILGYGPNAAIIHYWPTAATNRRISTDSTLVVDTGSNYKDGTCDTTRTTHLGTPTHEQKEAYTRVLKGQIQLARMIWPNTTQGRFLDIIARKELWKGGLDYAHGTGHGIGMYLYVHEGPQAIGMRCPKPHEHPIVPGMFMSDEPGYYKTGSYGIRLETMLLAVPAKVKSHIDGKYFITFEYVQLAPYERKMIDLDLLTDRELDWLNTFHRESRSKVGALLKQQGKTDVYEWLVGKTQLLRKQGKVVNTGARDLTATAILVVSGIITTIFIL